MLNLQMSPAPGTRLARHAGDFLTFELRGVPAGWTARVRTNLGRAERLREEIVKAHFERIPLAGASWRELTLQPQGDGLHSVTLPLAEVGFFKAKAYCVDPRGFQHWPHGPDVGVSVHPSWTRTGNTIYCVFPRMFGPNKTKRVTLDVKLDEQLKPLDQAGYTVIPPSGKLRDVIRELPHIIDTLGCRLVHLLPVSPTPTTFARFGRFGSPYALQHLTAIDPALVEFDQRTTGVDQFQELAYAVHARGARLMLDLVINHTGWGSALWEEHPEWFLRKPEGKFESPGAWDVVWEDLVELDQRHKDLWEHLAEAFLIWCRRGVDAFRCDAGYKVPTHVWQYITARVRQEYPDTVFLLEGLGGSWEATDALLGEGGMQWAYSELFQNFDGHSLSSYLDHSFRTSHQAGTLVHYSETHDNSRLAARPSPVLPAVRSPQPAINLAWSLHRNRLCALTSVNGGFGFTCGVEWAATEQINVHSARGLAWGGEPNLVRELARLNQLLREHPCFFDGAKLIRLSPDGAPVFALRRESAEALDTVLVLANTDPEHSQSIRLDPEVWSQFCCPTHDLLHPDSGPGSLPSENAGAGWIEITLNPGAVHCLSLTAHPVGFAGESYRAARARADWAVKVGQASRRFAAQDGPSIVQPGETAITGRWEVSPAFFDAVAEQVDRDPTRILAQGFGITDGYRPVVVWQRADRQRITLVPPGHWVLLRDSVPFRARLTVADGSLPVNVESIPANGGHIACLFPRNPSATADATLEFERYNGDERHVQATLRFLTSEPAVNPQSAVRDPQAVVLLTNGRGAMARLRVNLGEIASKYDCLLGANLDVRVPVDRHVFAKRVRVWVNADGFISPLNFDNLVDFEPGPPAHWHFVANAGDGRFAEIHLLADLLPEQNTVVLQFYRPNGDQREARFGRPLPPDAKVTLTVRVDIEDRNFHMETRRNDGADYHFSANCRQVVIHPAPATDQQSSFNGFEFAPAANRQLRVWTDRGEYHHSAEWMLNVPHSVEASRGQPGAGDAYSPGWFEVPMVPGDSANLIVTAEHQPPAPKRVVGFVKRRLELLAAAEHRAGLVEQASRLTTTGETPSNSIAEETPPKDRPEARPASLDRFSRSLVLATQAYVVRRDDTRSVIAGYPWFLDWGRDSLICARGLLAAGLLDEVRDLLITFGRFEKDGTLPNSIHGTDASNRDTSDAPLWFGVVCEDCVTGLTEKAGQWASGPESQSSDSTPFSPAGFPAFSPAIADFYATAVDSTGRTLRDVLRSIACGYLKGTPNGIRVDAQSGLVWSPSHFTWMDTNHPAGTPREGYPVEIQALWIRLLRQLAQLRAEPWEGRGESWADLAKRAEDSFHRFFWLEECGWYADVLLAGRETPARTAPPSNALRSNCLLVVALDIDRHPQFATRARRMVAAAAQHLVVPGALRSLAPLPVIPPLAIHGNHGALLNDPNHPYWPRYEGDEDTRRKPAYHNGTAWTWTFPSFAEALVKAFPGDPHALAAARAYLGSMDQLLDVGCLGHLPEITDGDAPHTQRGCDAQAWGATEALRVWRWLHAQSRGAAVSS
jgi:starch synthase (maltosyl-transferring)